MNDGRQRSHLIKTEAQLSQMSLSASLEVPPFKKPDHTLVNKKHITLLLLRVQGN